MLAGGCCKGRLSGVDEVICPAEDIQENKLRFFPTYLYCSYTAGSNMLLRLVLLLREKLAERFTVDNFWRAS